MNRQRRLPETPFFAVAQTGLFRPIARRVRCAYLYIYFVQSESGRQVAAQPGNSADGIGRAMP